MSLKVLLRVSSSKHYHPIIPSSKKIIYTFFPLPEFLWKLLKKIFDILCLKL